MRTVTRLQVALYGFLFHLVAAVLLVAKALRTPDADLATLLLPSACAAVAAFAVYALLVAPYAQKRYGSPRRGMVFYDFLIGMLAELAVVAVAALLFGLATTARALAAGGAGAWLSAAANATVFAFLWTVATMLTEVLALGNGAGFLGFIVLKRLAARRGDLGKG